MNDTDLMRRLGAANPVTETSLGAPAERDRLLAALVRAPAPRLPRSRAPRVLAAVALSALVGAIVVGIVLVAGRMGGESWSVPGGDRFHLVLERPPGRLWAETAVDGRRVGAYVPARDLVRVARMPAGIDLIDADPLERFRVLYRRGEMRESGRTRLRGQEVIRLEARDHRGAPYFVDARTQVPVEIRLRLRLPEGGFPTRRVRIRMLEFERLPLSAENRRLLWLFPHPGARVEQAGGPGWGPG